MTTSFRAPDQTDDFVPAGPWFGQELTIPYEGQTRMRLLFTKGVSDLSLRIGAGEEALLRGSFGDLVPGVSVGGDEVSIRYRRFGIADWLGGLLWGEGAGASLVLHPGVAWQLVFRGGASQLDIDLRQGHLTGLEISGGVSQVRLALPAPNAVVPLLIRGGASELALCRPADVPVGVDIRGGVSDLEIDGRHIGAAGGPISLDSDGWRAATARYDLQLTGGASELCVV
ncbi:MAG TPA: hypothetical protein VMT03_03215 [Polyangia bacterium]|nr:hypothetical protein [Polyangia bacterium]